MSPGDRARRSSGTSGRRTAAYSQAYALAPPRPAEGAPGRRRAVWRLLRGQRELRQGLGRLCRARGASEAAEGAEVAEAAL